MVWVSSALGQSKIVIGFLSDNGGGFPGQGWLSFPDITDIPASTRVGGHNLNNEWDRVTYQTAVGQHWYTALLSTVQR